MIKKIKKDANWRLLSIGRKLYLINVVNSKQLELSSSKKETNYLFRLLDKWKTKEQVMRNFGLKYPNFGQDWASEYLGLLTKNKVLEYEDRRPKELTNGYLLGLDRQLGFLAELDNGKSAYENQLLLKNTKVALLGLGSVAHYVIMALVSSGIGSFKCVDFDVVDERNIGRQPIFKRSDIGRPKSEVVKEYILNNRKNIDVQAFNIKLESEKDVEKIVSDCDIVIHLCDLPRFLIHRWINNACLKLNKPNILCYSGRVGPFCTPYKTACYGCLETEMRKKFVLYQQMANDITYGEFTRFPELAVVGSISGVLVAKEVVGHILNIKPQTYNAFFDINPFNLKVTLHKLPRQKDCYACSKRTMNKKSSKNPEIQVWQNDSKRKYISSYSAKIIGDNLGAYYVEGGSASINKEIAKNKAVFESIERYSGSKIPSSLVKQPYAKVATKAINPKNFIFYNNSQFNKRGFPYSKYQLSDQIEWIKGKALLNSKDVLIPAFAVYLGYNEGISKSGKYFPTPSSGLAVQKTQKKAIINAIFELVERSNAMKVWLNKLSAPVLTISTIHSPKLKNLISNINREGLSVAVLLSSQELPIPSFIAIVYSEKGKLPITTFGLSAGIDIEKAIQKSIEEALMVRCSLEYMGQTYGSGIFEKNPKQVKTFFDHSLYYSSPKKRKNWEFMIRGRKISIEQMKETFPLKKFENDFYRNLIDTLKKFEYDTYVVDLTSNMAGAMKLCCVKVIIPKLRQMEINNNLKFLGYGGKEDKKKLVKSFPHPYA